MKRKILGFLFFGSMIASLILGCVTQPPAQNAANQSAIDNRTRLIAARDTYATAVRTVDHLYTGGAISKATALTFRNELENVIRPSIDAAQDVLVTGDFSTAITKAETALAGFNTKTKAIASTQPAAALAK